jgi:hypothetical protein
MGPGEQLFERSRGPFATSRHNFRHRPPDLGE